MTFPTPCVIASGITKGGACKSSIAAWLASYLGRMNYWTLVLDMNPQCSLYNDYEIMQSRGIDCHFHCINDPFAGGEGRSFEQYAAKYQFVILDTFQHLDTYGTKWAWANCHALLSPITPDRADWSYFAKGVQQYTNGLNVHNGPIIAVPSKVPPFINSPQFSGMQQLLEDLDALGMIVPDSSLLSNFPDNNSSAGNMPVRTIYNKVDGFQVTDKFKGKVEFAMTWVLEQLCSRYGALPEPKSQPISSLL